MSKATETNVMDQLTFAIKIRDFNVSADAKFHFKMVPTMPLICGSRNYKKVEKQDNTLIMKPKENHGKQYTICFKITNAHRI